jgi:hypothetical protein
MVVLFEVGRRSGKERERERERERLACQTAQRERLQLRTPTLCAFAISVDRLKSS